MPSTGPINGTDFRLYLDGNAVAYATSFTLSLSRNVNELIHKDNPGDGWREINTDNTTKSGTVTIEALYAEDGSNNKPIDLFGHFDQATLLTFSAKTDTSGDSSYDGSGYITSLDFNGPVNETATFSATLEVTGQIASGTVS